MDLETVSKLVAKHSSPEALQIEKLLAENKRQRKMYQSLKWGMICLILGMALLTIVKTFGLDGKLNIVGALVLFMAMGLMCYSVLTPLREGAPSSRKIFGTARTAELPKFPEADTTKELPAASVPVPVGSVTERTTQLIANEKIAPPRE